MSTGNGCTSSSTCPKCKDTGYILEYIDGHCLARKCDCGCLERQQLEKQRKFASIPEAFKDMRLSNFSTAKYENTDQLRDTIGVIKYWTESMEQMIEDGTGLYIYSATKGSGKTRMAASIGNEIIEELGLPVKFVTSIQILNEIKKSWDEGTESDLLYQLSNVKVLIIDDFGTEAVKDWISERFYHIINERYINKRATIFTSNCSLADLEYDDRITNRILEMSIIVPFPEESIRKKISMERNLNIMREIRGRA